MLAQQFPDAAIDGPKAKTLDGILDGSRHTAATEVSDDDDSSRRGNLYFQQPRSESPTLITCEEDSDDIEENLAALEGSLAEHASDETDLPSKPGLGERARDSLLVLTDKVNDDEEHEANPHLEDYLVPREKQESDADEAAGPPPPTAQEVKPILHKDGSPEVAAEVAVDSSANPPKQKRNVSFGSICVRDYGMVLGDHPCTGYGPPVSHNYPGIGLRSITSHPSPLHSIQQSGHVRLGLLGVCPPCSRRLRAPPRRPAQP